MNGLLIQVTASNLHASPTALLSKGNRSGDRLQFSPDRRCSTFRPTATSPVVRENFVMLKKRRFRRLRHSFNEKIKRRVKGECQLDNWHGILAVLQIYLLIGFSAGMPYLLSKFTGNLVPPAVVWWASYFVAVILIGCWQRALATIVHESMHKTITKSIRLGKFLGTFCSGYLIAQGWTAYNNSHGPHHRDLGDDDHDKDLAYHISEGLYDPQSALMFVTRNLVSPLLLFKTPSKIADLIRNRLLAADEPWVERVSKFGFIAVVTGSFAVAGLGTEFCLFWLVPLVTTFPIVNWYIELCEHFPLVKESNIDIYMSRNRWTGSVGKFLTGQLNENYHQVHHLVPGCPFWKLPKVHSILMDDPVYRETQTRELGLVIPVLRGTPSIIMSLVDKVRRRAWDS